MTQGCLALMVMTLTGASAILVKERAGMVRPLAAVDIVRTPGFERPAVQPLQVSFRVAPRPEPVEPVAADTSEPSDNDSSIANPQSAIRDDEASAFDAQTLRLAQDPSVRWFDGRPARPAKQMWMTVTGYSPDERSCGDSADGKTATLHSVFTNGMKLVAADTSVLPFGSMVSVPGYDAGRIVPVLDRGGAIKGSKLDLLFPTYEDARQWGKRKLLVTVWEYADGKPAVDPRKLR